MKPIDAEANQSANAHEIVCCPVCCRLSRQCQVIVAQATASGAWAPLLAGLRDSFSGCLFIAARCAPRKEWKKIGRGGVPPRGTAIFFTSFGCQQRRQRHETSRKGRSQRQNRRETDTVLPARPTPQYSTCLFVVWPQVYQALLLGPWRFFLTWACVKCRFLSSPCDFQPSTKNGQRTDPGGEFCSPSPFKRHLPTRKKSFSRWSLTKDLTSGSGNRSCPWKFSSKISARHSLPFLQMDARCFCWRKEFLNGRSTARVAPLLFPVIHPRERRIKCSSAR